MHDLQLRRLKFSKEADTWLKVMKSRTGITPNLLCRIGFCLSLEEPGVPRPELYPEDSDREINRGTLLGEHDTVFVALLRQRLAEDGVLGTAPFEDQFRAHMHRGVILLAGRMKTLAELGEQFSVRAG